MSVDLIALYLKLYAQCQQSPDKVYRADFNRFYQDTGYTTVNVLSPLIANGTIEVSTPDSGATYHIRMVAQ